MAQKLFDESELSPIKKKLLERIEAEVQEPLPNVRFLDAAAKLIDSLTRAVRGNDNNTSIWEIARELADDEGIKQ